MRQKAFLYLTLCILLSGCVERRTPDEEARTLMELPPDAVVVSVEHGDWSGDYIVSFYWDSEMPHADALDKLWTDNLVRTEHMPTGPKTVETYRIYCQSGGSKLREIRYLSDGLYEYEQMLEK